jgi:hypothetical protein
MARQHEIPDLDTGLRPLLAELRHLEGTWRADRSREQLPELWACLDRIRPHLEQRWPAKPIEPWRHPEVDHRPRR